MFFDYYDWLIQKGLLPIIVWRAVARSDEVRGNI